MHMPDQSKYSSRTIPLDEKQSETYERVKSCWEKIRRRTNISSDVVNQTCSDNADLYIQLRDAGAFPQSRLDFFQSADCNPGGYGKSRFEILQRNAGNAREAMESVDFLRYMQVLVEGPQLPQHVISGFAETMNGIGSTGMIMNDLCAYVRKAMREDVANGDTLPVEDSFALLAVELDYPHVAQIRNAAMQGKRGR